LKILKRAYNSDGFDLALQDSKEAGQSVFHVHLHLLPRKKGDIDGDPSSWFSLILENNNRDIPEQEMKENIEKIKKSMVK
jgi:diadenosine tetraphosphate (Ap4A) HIT family hydrolase